ncbi:MAG: N-acetylglucosamine-6-phosphate deacetylase [Acidobacteriota bacterium]|nr:N-acetylglucosamine-6-phosphate deacetylase [Acidobacteriota bacterium]
MTTTLLHAARAITPTGEIANAGILIREGVIEAIGPREGLTVPADATEVIAKDKSAIPGFVDIHIHGAGGRDVMEATPDAMAAVTRMVARHGTTSIVATTVSASPEETCRSCEGIAQYIASQHESGDARAEVLGIHFEGPFLNKLRRGVHPEKWLTLPSAELLEKFIAAAGGNARILTIAPELLGAIPCIDAARKAGMVVGIGHTDATYEQARMAIAHGARHAVHVYNAMRPFSHRDSGVIGAVLTTPDVTAELIADGVHVEEAAMRLLLRAKNTDCVMLVSDGVSATGMPDGKYMLGQFEVIVTDGVCRNSEGKLAGSTLTLDKALRNVMALGKTFEETTRMLTLNPAGLLGVEFKKGALRVGADADILLIDEEFQLANVWIRGMAVN